ncbi:NADH:flavin oxidoreductase [Rhodospirillales bacterium]|nr:NADH:flavin oxidoreductase [Rhodospirillales bacterium]
MWKPSERVKYEPNPGLWPTVEEASNSLLFSPVKLGSITLEQRTWVPAMVPWRATKDGFVTENVLDWYERFAKGRPGGLVIEATGIRDVPSGPLLRIGHDRFIPGLRELADTVRRASEGHTKLFIQCIDFLAIRRRPDKNKFLRQFLAITDEHRAKLFSEDLEEAKIRGLLLSLNDQQLDDILTTRELEDLRIGYREKVIDVQLPHIKNLPHVLPELFANAAERAQESGIDGVELHYAHAYTMASFLSRLNNREDGYGGSLEGRARLPLEVFSKVRERVGPDYPVGCRYLSDDCITGGTTVNDAMYFGVEFARAGMDFLSLSRGGKFEDAKQPKVGEAAYPYTGRSGYECMPAHISDEFGPFGRNIEPCGRIRRVVKEAGFETPIIVTGGIHGFNLAEQILNDGNGDIIGAARQSMADPDWFRKVHLGRGEEVRLCTYSNYCEGLDQKHKVVTCKLWDRTELEEPGINFSSDGKRRTTAPEWVE